MRTLSPIVWLLIAGCTASEPLLLPIDESTRSLLFAIRERKEKPRIYAFERDDVPPLSIGEQDLFLIAYPNELSELGLTIGPQPVPGDSDPTRPFPPGYSAYRAAGDRASWSSLTPEELVNALGDRVLADVMPCEASGGCIRRIEEEGRQFCELPCFAPREPLPPNEPEVPALPDFGRCPSGWRSRPTLAADATFCEPLAIEVCAAGTTHFLGDAGCSPIGAECTPDGWPADLPSGRTIHFVRPGSNGDGTSTASPFGTIASAIAAAAPSDVIALHASQHAGGFTIDRSIAIIGACAGTTIAGGAPAIRIAADVSLELSNVTIEPEGDGLEIQGSLSLSGVTIAGGTRGAVVSGDLIANEILIRDTSAGGLLGIGPAQITVIRGDFANNVAHGIRIEGSASARLVDVVVRGSMTLPNGTIDTKGYGAISTSTNPLIITRALFERNRGNAIAAWYSATASVTFAVDRDGLGDYSFDLDNRARGQASHLVTLGAQKGSVWAFRSGRAEVSDVYVSRSGGGLFARMNGVLIARRVLLEENNGTAVESSDGSNVMLSDLVVRDQVMGAADTGQGILVNRAAATADRIQIVRPTGHGIEVRGAANGEAAATLQDVHVSGVRPRSPGTIGFGCTGDGTGLRIRSNTSVTLRRAIFEGGVRGIGVDSYDQHRLEHVLIRGAQRTGLCVNNGTYSVNNFRIEDVVGIGLDLFGGYLETSELAIVGTRTLENGSYGIGVHLHGVNNIMDVRVAILPLTSFLFFGNETRAIQMENGSQAMLKDGVIAGSEIGIELINQPGFDLATLYDNVIFRNVPTIVVSR